MIAVATDNTNAAAVSEKESAVRKANEIRIVTSDIEERPVRPLRRTADLLIGAALIAMPVLGLGAYIYFALPVSGFGVLFLVGQWLLNRKDPQKGRLIASWVVRLLGLIVIVLCLCLFLGAGSERAGQYKTLTKLYTLGNYGKGEMDELDFMPDELPDTCKGYKAEYISKKIIGSEYGSIRIRFITDKQGREELEKLAVKQGAEECSDGDFVYTKLAAYCDSIGKKMNGAKVYSFGEQKNHSPAYLINSRTGLCVIYW